MIIKGIKTGKRGNSLLLFDENYNEKNFMSIKTEILIKNGLKVGDCLGEENLEELISESEIHKAKEKALNLLSYRGRSKKELKNRIAQKSNEAYADIAVKKMEDLGLINDKAFAKEYALELLHKRKFSISGAKYKLREKGIDNEIIEEALEEIDINEEQQALDVINKKFLKITADEKGKKRVMNVLIRLGYNQSVIKRAFAIYESSNG
jgi:Uncharacterized protein conserved in bacteria